MSDEEITIERVIGIPSIEMYMKTRVHNLESILGREKETGKLIMADDEERIGEHLTQQDTMMMGVCKSCQNCMG